MLCLQILQHLEQCKSAPDFSNYLAYIFANADELPVEVRQSAGLYLKNNIRKPYKNMAPEHRQYIQVNQSTLETTPLLVSLR